MRHWYALSTEPGGADELVAAVLAAVRPATEFAEVRSRGLGPGAPEPVVRAWSTISDRPLRGVAALAVALRRALGARVPVRVAATDVAGWAALASCAPWVESVDLLGAERITGRIHAAGCSAVIELAAEQGAALARDLGTGGRVDVERLADKQAWYRMGQ